MTTTDLETFLFDNEERVFRFLVYRRLFTPYEQDLKAFDESFYEDYHYSFGMIQEAIDLGDGDWLLGFRMIDETTGEVFDHVEYYRLREIRLSSFDSDQNLLYQEEEEEGD